MQDTERDTENAISIMVELMREWREQGRPVRSITYIVGPTEESADGCPGLYCDLGEAGA